MPRYREPRAARAHLPASLRTRDGDHDRCLRRVNTKSSLLVLDQREWHRRRALPNQVRGWSCSTTIRLSVASYGVAQSRIRRSEKQRFGEKEVAMPGSRSCAAYGCSMLLGAAYCSPKLGPVFAPFLIRA